MSEIGPFVTEFVSSTARSLGFTRKGQKFWRTDQHGNLAVLRVSPPRFAALRSPGTAEMTITEMFALASAAGFRKAPGREAKHVEGYGPVWAELIEPPPEARLQTTTVSDPWAYTDPDSRLMTGQALKSKLAEEVLPRLVNMSDPEFLLAHLTAMDKIVASAYTVSLLRVEVLARSQSGPSQSVISDWFARARRDGDDSLVEWLMTRFC